MWQTYLWVGSKESKKTNLVGGVGGEWKVEKGEWKGQARQKRHSEARCGARKGAQSGEVGNRQVV